MYQSYTKYSVLKGNAAFSQSSLKWLFVTLTCVMWAHSYHRHFQRISSNFTAMNLSGEMAVHEQAPQHSRCCLHGKNSKQQGTDFEELYSQLLKRTSFFSPFHILCVRNHVKQEAVHAKNKRKTLE